MSEDHYRKLERMYASDEAELFDHRGKHAGRGSGTFMKSTIALTPDVGYI